MFKLKAMSMANMVKLYKNTCSTFQSHHTINETIISFLNILTTQEVTFTRHELSDIMFIVHFDETLTLS